MDDTRFILLNTSHPGNVGATARAMKVMGFGDLVHDEEPEPHAPLCTDTLCASRHGLK
jgi:tRNA C32,U32 (ribose-2'-O)-methylase TrmJ